MAKQEWNYNAIHGQTSANLVLKGNGRSGVGSNYLVNINFVRQKAEVSYKTELKTSPHRTFDRLKKAEEGIELLLYENKQMENKWKTNREVLHCILDIEKQFDLPDEHGY